jgi:segregation and condensation protein A
MAIDFTSQEDPDGPVSPAYEVRLDRVFEGPMDLLVHLIKKNEVDIYDIPIALITEQFLAYIDLMKSLNIDLAGDFIVMAASLTQIKSRMLLPSHEEDLEEEDPRMEIARPLLEYLQMKAAAESLADRPLLGEHTFTRPAQAGPPPKPDEEMIKIGIFELIDAFQQILGKTPKSHRIDLTEDTLSIKDRISQLIDLLETKATVSLDELLPHGSGKREVIITFLAILEMAKLSLISIAQQVQSGIIRLFYR